MPKRKKSDGKPRIPKVRIAEPVGRPIQVRYKIPGRKREVRISTGTYDLDEAEAVKAEVEAKLRLGIDPEPRCAVKCRDRSGPEMAWDEFRQRYTDLQLTTLREKSAMDAESRLDIAQRIVKPRTLADMANSHTLHVLQTRLLAGAESRFNRPRSPHTVKTCMASVLASLNWAVYMEWLPSVPRIKRVKVSKLKHMKGRPLAGEEFERMLQAVPAALGAAISRVFRAQARDNAKNRGKAPTVREVPTEVVASWRYALHGLVESGLRVGELMAMHWTDPNQIQPVWPRAADPILAIPHELQKNDTEESIPLLPGFEAVLLKTPEADRTGWVFNPLSLQGKLGRRARKARPATEWVARVVAAIGERAGVVVEPEDPKTGRPAKFASSHDLRRTCAQHLDDAGLREDDIMRVMRHRQRETLRRHYAPGTVQKSAKRIREQLVAAPDDRHGYSLVGTPGADDDKKEAVDFAASRDEPTAYI